MFQHVEASLDRIVDEWMEDHLGVIVSAGAVSAQIVSSAKGSHQAEWVWLNSAGAELRHPIQDWYAPPQPDHREGDALLHARAGLWPLAMRVPSSGAEPTNGRDRDWWRRIRRLRLDEAAAALVKSAAAGEWKPRPLACKVLDGVMRTLQQELPSLGIAPVVRAEGPTVIAPVVLPGERDGFVALRDMVPNQLLGNSGWLIVIEERGPHLTFQILQARPLDLLRVRLTAALTDPAWKGLLLRAVTPEGVTQTLGAYWSTQLLELQRSRPRQSHLQITVGEGQVTHLLRTDRGGLAVTHPLPVREPRVAQSHAWTTDAEGFLEEALGTGWGIPDDLATTLASRWRTGLTSGESARPPQ